MSARLAGMAGAPFRRRVELSRPEAGVVEAEVEDHIHHFAVRVQHGGGRVSDIAGRAVRAPWSTCPGAAAVLSELVGAPVDDARVVDPGAHCTHLLDLALVAVRFAGTDVPARRFDLVVDGWDGPAATATVRRDDGLSLRWSLRGMEIAGPEPYVGHRLGAGFTSWAITTLAADEAELALLLRRAAWMSSSRGIDLDDFDRLSELPIPPGSCFSAQPQRIELARRNVGSSLG